MSKWLKTIENSQVTQAVKTKAGDWEGIVESKVHSASGKIQGLIYEEEEGAHRVSNYNWKRAMFKFRATLHHGIPGTPTVISFDPIQKIMAVGTSNGLVKIFGKPGVEVVVNQYEGSISHLCFVQNHGKLVIVHKGGTCEGVNLDSKRSIGSYVFKNTEVTCLEHVPNTEFVLVGLSTGNVHVISTANKLALSNYRISGRSSLQVDKSSGIAGLAFHPTQPNLLLIAHDCGNINEWDLTREKGVHHYSFANENSNITTITWHPDGLSFAAGFRNGDVVIWKRGQSTHLPPFAMSEHPNTPRRPIKKLFYSSLHNEVFIGTFGGTSMSHEPDSGVVKYNNRVIVLPPKIVSESSKGAKRASVVDMVIAHPTSFPFSVEPWSIILVTENSDLTVYSPSNGRFKNIIPSPNFQLQSSKVTCTLFSKVSQGFLNDLSHRGDVSWKCHEWPILGGSSSIQPHTSTDVLVTGHSDGMVFFWDMSNTHFNLLYSVNILTDSEPSSPEILSIDLCVESRVLAVSCASGETFVYYFNNTPKKISPKQKILTTRALELQAQKESNYIIANVAVTANPISNPTVSSPEAQISEEVKSNSSPAVETKSRQVKERTSKKERTSQTMVFSWEKFFENAKIDKKSAAKYAEFFEGEKITDDLVKDLDQDMMEMAGITTVGDKMRIKKYINNGYNVADCMVSGTSTSTTSSKKKSSKKRTKKREKSSRRPMEETETPKLPAKSSPVVSPVREVPVYVAPEPEPIVPLTELPPGYQLKTECSFRNRITQIRIASSLSKIAVGDHHGSVALLDITNGNVLLHKSLGGKRKSPVTWLCFDDRAVVEKQVVESKKHGIKSKKTKKETLVEPGLFVGLKDGRIFYVALRTGQVDSIAFKDEEEKIILSSILLLDGTGAAVVPNGISWEKLLSESEEENFMKEEDDEEEIELVIRNLDEERERTDSEKSISPKVDPHTAPSLEDSKYLLVCAGHMITIYQLPSYRTYSTFQCPEEPEAANVVERDNGNYCLVVFLASGDLIILTLMDLLEIKTVPKALQTIGVKFEKRRLAHDVNCTPDGRFVVLSKFQEVIRGSLFSDENLLGLPFSLPKLHVANIPASEEDEQKGEVIFNVSEFNRLFGTVKVQEAERAPPVNRPVTRAVAGPNERNVDAQRKKLIGDAKPVKIVTPNSNSKFSVGEKIVRSVGSSVSDVKEIMCQNMDALAQRQEKLEEMLVSSDHVANRAGAFADIAGQMAEKEKNKKWWQ